MSVYDISPLARFRVDLVDGLLSRWADLPRLDLAHDDAAFAVITTPTI